MQDAPPHVHVPRPVPPPAYLDRPKRAVRGREMGTFALALGGKRASGDIIDEYAHVSIPSLHTVVNSDHPIPSWTPYVFSTTTPSNITEPVSFGEAMQSGDRVQWLKGCQNEWEGLHAMGTFSELTECPLGVKPLGTKWVFKYKRDEDGNVVRHKARLVVKGYMQREGIDFGEIFAPVGSATALRSMCAIAASKGWVIHQIDFVQAFLNGDLHDDIFVCQPEGFDDGSGRVYKLKRALYGLKQAPKAWFDTLKASLLKLGYRQSDVDAGVFFRGDICLILYVDDKLVMGPTREGVQQAINEIGALYDITDLGPARMYLGVEIDQSVPGKIKLSQKRYVEALLEKYDIVSESTTPASTTKSAPCDIPCIHPFAELVGALLHLSVWTRPDISYAVGRLTRVIKAPSLSDWHDASRVLQYLKGTSELGLTYSQSDTELIGYTDADFAGDVNGRKSTSGLIFLLAGGPICWKSKLQQTVALSSCESEYMAAASAAREAIWLRKFLPEMTGVLCDAPTTVHCDNKGCLDLLKNPICSMKSKHIDTIHHFARERVGRGDLQFLYIRSEYNLADIFTKALSPTVFTRLRDIIMS